MSTAKIITFRVRGYGPFPVDMLRHDQAWPQSTEDALSIAATGDDARQRRTVTLNSINRYPTMGRWESFGWANVLEESGLPYIA